MQNTNHTNHQIPTTTLIHRYIGCWLVNIFLGICIFGLVLGNNGEHSAPSTILALLSWGVGAYGFVTFCRLVARGWAWLWGSAAAVPVGYTLWKGQRIPNDAAE